MAAVAAPPRPLTKARLSLRERFELLPNWAIAGGALIVLLAASAFIRSRYIGGEFWMDEAITTGIASHSLSAIPGILRHDGSPPLFYLLLHVWMSIFGSGESATHALTLLIGLLTIPVGMWAGWSLFGRRAGLMAAVLFAFSTFLTQYAQETRMYELMGLLGLVATTAFIHGFIYRRRKYLILFAVCEALMLYTHAWGMFYAAGSLLALIPVYRASSDRRGLLRDAAMAYAGAGILFLPWLPNFIYQATHTGAPWAPPPRFGAPVLLSRDLIGGDRITIGLVLGTVVGLGYLFTRAYRRTRDATVLWALITLPAATLLLAWLASQVTPAFVSRYFAPVLGPLMLLAAWGLSRARAVGIVALALSVLFVVHISSYTPQYKSDMRDISGEMSPLLHSGDWVIFAQPEEVSLGWYYLPPGLHYANTLGPVSDPTYMNWVFALKRLRAASPVATLAHVLAMVKPGQQILYVRSLTEGAKNWQASWTQLVRRRSAQWGELLSSDPSLKPEAVAPHTYRPACCVGNSTVLYLKTS
jgi:mannosyltransferase